MLIHAFSLSASHFVSCTVFRRHGGLDPIVSWRPMDLCCFFGVAPAPFCVVSLFFCWRNANLAGRFAGRRCCRFLFVLFFMMCLGCEAKEFHIFCTLFYRFSHRQDRALERERPQQRKKIPKITHIPGQLNDIADALSRFKQPLPEPLTLSNQCEVRWQTLLDSASIFTAQSGRRWPHRFCIGEKHR